MAKTYSNVFSVLADKMIADGVAPLISTGVMNSSVKFLPVGASETEGGQIEYIIQKMIRPVDSAKADRTGNAGDDFVSDLNTAQDVN